MNGEGEILHDPLQWNIGWWDGKMNSHPWKPPESLEEYVD
jgi:hypothetical protein